MVSACFVGVVIFVGWGRGAPVGTFGVGVDVLCYWVGSGNAGGTAGWEVGPNATSVRGLDKAVSTFGAVVFFSFFV